MQKKRITIFAGHYGSGKTNLALNYTFWLKAQGGEVSLCDLDIVNPYFRTVDAKDKLAAAEIRLISSPYANTNVELPAMPVEARAIFDNHAQHAVIDLGGDERGALAMGQYAKLLLGEGDYEMLLVVNPYRPLTSTNEGLAEIVREIESAGRVPFTGVVNNANLGPETTLEAVYESLPFAREAAERLGLPLKMTAIHKPLLEGGVKLTEAIRGESEIFPIEIFEKPNWIL